MELLPHQVEVVEKFSNVRSRLVGDSMGVGKTVTGIGLDLDLRKRHGKPGGHFRTLIICQKNGISIWVRHLLWFGVANNRILAINPGDRSPFEKEMRKGAWRHSYFICHWDVLTKLEDLSRKVSGKPFIEWHHIIADEAHLAKNMKAARTRELKSIKAPVKTALTGTPADDKPQELFSILQWLYPRKYTSYWKFVDYYMEWEQSYTGYRVILGPKLKRMPELHRELEPFYIRRTLHDVRADMPKKSYSRIEIDLTPKQRRDYEAMRKWQVAQLGDDPESELVAPVAIAVHQRLQQMALGTVVLDWTDVENGKADGPKVRITEPSPKLNAVMEAIETHEDEPFVVFTQFVDMADLVEAACQKRGIGVSKITGRIANQKVRDQAVSNFQTGVTRVFVGTIGAAGTGITLNRAHTVIFVDRNWNPSKNEQATDRIYRIDNDAEPIQVIDIVARNTIDEYRLEKIGKKALWLQQLLTPPSQGLISEAISDLFNILEA